MKAMKNIRSVMAALPLILSPVVYAETEKVGNYTWQYSVVDGKAWIGSGVAETAAIFPKPVGEVTVPSELGGYEVWRLDVCALYGCDEMTKLIIADCVHQCGGSAFQGCSSLVEVHLPESLGYVAGDLFRGCSSLKEVVLPANVAKIDSYAFKDCSSLTNIVLNDGLERIGEYAFYCCSNLVDVVVPNSVTNIDRNAFSCCSGLNSLTLPFVGSQRGNFTTGECAFGWIFGVSPVSSADDEKYIKVKQWCNGGTLDCHIPKSLKSVVITDETIVACCSFDDCRNLESVIIGNSVTNIQSRAFAACKGLQNLILPFVGAERNAPQGTTESLFGYIFGVKPGQGLIQIQQKLGANEWCTNYVASALVNVTITDETRISTGAFQNCSNLTSVVIGNSVTNIAKGAFSGCGGLQSITLPFTGINRKGYADEDSEACPEHIGYIFGTDSYIKSQRIKIYSGTDVIVSYYVPAGLKCVAITDASELMWDAFYCCNMITNISLNVGIESIGGYSFRNCTGIKSIVIPDSVKQLDVAAFRGSGLEHIFVPLSVMDMSSWTFESCSSLHLAYVPRRFKGNLGYNTFANCAADLQVIYYDENMRFFDETLRTDDNSETNLVAVCTNDCRVTFKWKCSCEPLVKGNPYDYLSFSIDGVQQAFICGETDWTEQTYTVSGAGEHTFTWTYQKDAQDAAGEDCGWVKQVVVAPLVTLSFDGGEADRGTPPAAMSFYADDDTAVLPGCGTLALANYSFAGWSDGEMVYAAGSACPYLKAAQTLTAVWAANTLSVPVISAPATYEADSATVTITADEGANIYYTLNGSVPSAAATLYTMPFEVEGSASVRAIAVRDNYFDSEVAEFEVTRLTWTFGEYLNSPERTFTTGGDAEWVRAKGVSSDGFALRSGAITHSQTSRLETVVYGAGTIRFSCKVDGEIVKKIVYDGLAFCVDGVQQGDLMGDTDWTEKTFTVTGDGRHVLGWLYVKDEDGNGGGEDCAWVDCVSWAANDPLPPLDVQATDSDAAAIVGGLSDERLPEKIVGIAAYWAFRTWVDGKGLSHTVVRDAPNAWFSYALDAPGLMAKATPLASEDIVIESIEPSGVTSGAFDLVVGIAGAEIGAAANLAEVFGVEGATELNESMFSSEGLAVTLQRTPDGKAKAMVTPVGSPSTFFMRVKVK